MDRSKEYADVADVVSLYRTLTRDEAQKAAALIPIICASLRSEARKVGKDLDAMIEADEDMEAVAKSVTVDIVARCLMTPTSGAPMTQMSEAALGYSVSGTFLNPGGGLLIKRSELARLGLRRQRIGGIDLYGND